jgi:NOL1/NOP2/sun family putative RNA methylase
VYTFKNLRRIKVEKIVSEFLIEELNNQYDSKTVSKILEGYNAKRKVTLRINTLKSSKEKICEELKNAGIEYSFVPWSENAIIIENALEVDLKKLSIYENGEIYLQSLSSMIPAIILEPKEKENILDMCAAPGGKTTQIAAMCENRVMLTACEKNKIRSERLKYNLNKQGVKCVNVMVADARTLSDYFSFDKILLDAPCSGSGTEGIFGKDFSEDLIKRSAKFQEELLKKAIKLLKPGKQMIYSTCSILEKENEEILDKMKKTVKIVPIDLLKFKDVPVIDGKIKGTLNVCPNELYEGFFVAKLEKII